MTDIAVTIALSEAALLDVAKQASGLAIGLQNAAPGSGAGAPNKSVQYLLDIAAYVTEAAARCKKILSLSTQEQSKVLFALATDVVMQDKQLREQHQMAEKFRFIRDRLQAVLQGSEELVQAEQQAQVQKTELLSDDETVVYVYLFNAHGVSLPTWQKMVSAAIFYEHSVNRPIYREKIHVEGFIGRKPNKAHHAYIAVAIKKIDILSVEGTESKDSYDQPLIKVREGSLIYEKFIGFTHNGIDYVLNAGGVLEKKP